MNTNGLLMASVLSAVLVGPVQAQQRIDLTIVSGFAPTVLAIKHLEERFIPQVNERLAAQGEYQINWNVAFGGSIARPRGELEAISGGIADLGVIPPVFHEDAIPLVNVPWVAPFVADDLGLVVRTVDDLFERIPAMGQDFVEHNLVHLATMGMVSDMNLVCKNPLASVEDFQGVRIAGAGNGLLYLGGVGAVGVNSNLAEYYNNLQTGLVDCAMMWPESANTFKVYEVAPYFIKIGFGAVPSYSLSFNKDSWGRLPGPVQAILSDAADDYRDTLAERAIDVAEESLASFAANGEIIELDQDVRVAWANALDNIAMNWAQALDARGKPGTETIQAYMDIMRAANDGIVRQWDQDL